MLAGGSQALGDYKRRVDYKRRLVVINAVLRDVATKQDIAELRRSLEAKIEREIERVEREIERLEREIDRLYRLVMISVLGVLVSVATTVLVRVLLP